MNTEIERLQILIIEDSTPDFILTESYLSAKFEHFKATHVKTATDAVSELKKSKNSAFDVILLDLSLPDNEGEKLIRLIQAQAPYTPIVILTGYSNIDFSIKSLSMGISDYLLKDEITPALLQKSILYSIQRYHFSSKLKQSRDNYSSLVNNIKETVYRTDIGNDFKLLFISSHIEKLTGYPPTYFTEPGQKTLFNLIDPDDRIKVKLCIEDAVENGCGWELEYRLLHKDRSIRHVIDKGNLFYNKEDDCHYCDGCILDITDRKKIEEQLQLREEVFRSIFENAAIGMGVTDVDGTIQKVNSSLCTILGYSKKELIGKNTLDLVHPHLLRKNLRNMSQLLQGTIDFFHSEEKYIHKKGHTVWCILSVSLVRDDAGIPVNFIGQITDITDKKNVELELEKLNQNLETKVAERTRLLEFANKELESFSYSVSHDLRAPLRAIDGFSQVILEDYSEKLDKTGHDYLNRIRSASQKLSRLIDHFLALAKVSRTSIEKKTVNLSNIVENVAEMLKTSDPDRNVTFEIEKNIMAYADPRLIRTVIQNLIENAWKYTSLEKKARIEFGQLQKDQNPVYFVKDNGAGFDMKFYENLFQPFRRLHKEKDYSGSGIGLATVNRIIERHSGKIWAYSEVGSGSVFYFTLS
ncbi:MAG TPA: PAS domain S-box protein [Bacteroidales bacterium]|nr:PAS domain S-box protein [Bacteroidales bacterium]